MALTTNRNYLQPTGFKFIIERTNYPNLEYFAQSVTHPGSSVQPLELANPRIVGIPLAGDKINYGEMSVDIILDEDMTAYKEMQAWLERIINDGHVEDSFGSKEPTASDITVLIMSSHNNSNVKIKYNDCIPTNIGSITLASNAGDLQFTTFQVSFRFVSFEIS
jgi:hypothetical protein